jgi:long-chain acyl-CoA synthetase
MLDIVNGDEPSERRIKAFSLIENDFSIDGGELTPTLKVKRRVIATKYAQEIDTMYATADAIAHEE